MQTLFSFTLAVLPSLFLVRYYYKQDQARPEPKGVIVKLFLLGIIYSLPVYILEWAASTLNVFSRFSSVLHYFFEAFVVAGLCEEYIKQRIVLKHIYHKKIFDESLDGIVYAVVAGLGFACMENIIYVMNTDWQTAIARGLSAVPMHAMASGVMGYYVGQAKFSSSPQTEKALINRGLWQAILIHGSYDFFVFMSPIVGSIFSLCAVQVIFTSYVRLRKDIQRAKDFDEEKTQKVSDTFRPKSI